MDDEANLQEPTGSGKRSPPPPLSAAASRSDPTIRTYARVLIAVAPLMAIFLGVIQWVKRNEWLVFGLLETFFVSMFVLACAELTGRLSNRRQHQAQLLARGGRRTATVRWRPDRIGGFLLLVCSSGAVVTAIYIGATTSAWWGVGLCVVFLPVTYAALLGVANTHSATVVRNELHLASRPLPNPLSGRTINLSGACRVDYSLITLSRGFSYSLTLHRGDGTEEHLGHLDSEEEAAVVAAELNTLVLRRAHHDSALSDGV